MLNLWEVTLCGLVGGYRTFRRNLLRSDLILLLVRSLDYDNKLRSKERVVFSSLNIQESVIIPVTMVLATKCGVNTLLSSRHEAHSCNITVECHCRVIDV
jgi:hypothetical protein